MELLLIVGAGVLLMYLMTRGQRKQLKEQQRQIEAMTSGTRVMLTSGIYCTVREVGERQIIVELAPGVDVAVAKQAVRSVVAEETEEFEFDDSLTDVESNQPSLPEEPEESLLDFEQDADSFDGSATEEVIDEPSEIDDEKQV
uniref:preprotein translocase subunit YajC n=1 Tax=Vaginimicrobium propionicum TaxID=1871034 RepID=UPI0009709710|nr:preprotein translocase subunit YajC [Vaginimicrobium propionicum]